MVSNSFCIEVCIYVINRKCIINCFRNNYIAEAISMCDQIAVLSARPATIKCVHDIQLTIEQERTPLISRKAPEFKDYFDMLWRELGVHEA